MSNQKNEKPTNIKEFFSDIVKAVKEDFNEIPTESKKRLDDLDVALGVAYPIQQDDTQCLNTEALTTKSKLARFTLKDVVLPATTANEIRESLIKVRFHGLIYETWGFNEVDPSGTGCVLNFYGPPGTGKSRAAEALAGELGMPFIKVDLAELESKFMGDTAKNLCARFQEAKEESALLFFDEADTVLGKRLASVTQGVDAEINMTRSTMLIEMDGFSGVLVFASNFPENYDAAFRRRISHHIHFQLPDFEARVKLWDMHLVQNIPLSCHSRSGLLTHLAEQSEGFSGGYVLQAMRLALPMAVDTDSPELSALTELHLLKAIELVKRGMREVGGDVQEHLHNTRNMFGIKSVDDKAHAIVDSQEPMHTTVNNDNGEE